MIDHLNLEINQRFDSSTITAYHGLSIIPSNVISSVFNVNKTNWKSMKVVNITKVMIKLQFKLPKSLISRGFTQRTVFHAPCFSAKRDQSIDGHLCIRYGSLNFRLGIRYGPLSKHPLPPARHLPHLTIASIHPTFPGINHDQEMRQCIINKSYRTALITSENPELREVDLEPSSKRGCSNK